MPESEHPQLGAKKMNRRLWLVETGMKTELVTPKSWVPELDAYARWMKASGKPDSTMKLRLYHLKRFAINAPFDHPFDADMDDLIEHLGDPNWGPHTKRSVRSSLRTFYAWAMATGRTSDNPAGLLPSVPIPIGKPRPAKDEAVEYGMQYRDPRVRLMIELGTRAGLRCIEISRVNRDDLTASVFEGGTVMSLRVRGKGDRVRMVPIASDLASKIAENADPSTGWLFPGLIDGHLSAGYVSKLVSRALPEGVTAHPLRHRFASRAYRGSNYNIRAVQELLGHSSVATTQVYTAVDDDDLRRAALSAA